VSIVHCRPARLDLPRPAPRAYRAARDFINQSREIRRAMSNDLREDLKTWQPRPRPARTVLEGRTVRLEPLDSATHGDGLYEVSSVADAESRFAWLPDAPPRSRAEFQIWLDKSAASDDPLYYAIIDKATGKVVGRQSLLRIDPANGAIEIGHVYWGPDMARTRGATEAQYLFTRHVFEDLGYRRYEWKSNTRNLPSRRAAERFGFTFEGIFRQHMIVKGENRDTAWYAMIDKDWPALARAYTAWLDPANFDSDGQQIQRLEDLRTP
jgi:RimJ/RimL family protein N-acetyltransferase